MPHPSQLIQTPCEVDDFLKLDIRVGTVQQVTLFEKAKKPAFKLWIHFGTDIGIKKSSAQITNLYTPESLLGRQVVAVVNFPPRQIADFMSEVLVLGVVGENGVQLLQVEGAPVPNGSRIC